MFHRDIQSREWAFFFFLTSHILLLVSKTTEATSLEYKQSCFANHSVPLQRNWGVEFVQNVEKNCCSCDITC
jgi:hypothetical protein